MFGLWQQLHVDSCYQFFRIVLNLRHCHRVCLYRTQQSSPGFYVRNWFIPNLKKYTKALGHTCRGALSLEYLDGLIHEDIVYSEPLQSIIKAGLSLPLEVCRCIYASTNWVIISSGDDLSPIQRQAITWTNYDLFSIGHFGTILSGICVKRQYFPFTKLQLKLSSPKCLPHVYLRELHKGNGFYLLCWWWIMTGRYSDSSPDVRRALTLRCKNTLKLRQDGHRFSEDIFKCIFLNEMYKFQWRIHWSLILFFFYLCFHINYLKKYRQIYSLYFYQCLSI